MSVMNPRKKYAPIAAVPIKNREWPDRRIVKAPVWCSVDLRDGNQALVNPMGIETKLAFFDLLVKTGFKEIEVGFPASSDTEYEFIRRLIEENRIPDDVTIQVLCQAREQLVKKTMECLKGVNKAIFHIYNSTSPAQRKYTFGKSKEEIVKIAVDGVKCVKSCLSEKDRKRIRLEYSPESFSMTEMDFAVEICEAVKNEWQPSAEDKIILNLPTTVECSTPNVYADQVEYFSKHITQRENTIISIHNHNDRGEGVATAEMGLLAGADRVEGCLFGNGERTGNLDIVTIALNMFSEGVDPELDFRDVPSLAAKYTEFTGMEIPVRTPYAGELVFTAFSGSHQDAIRKGMGARAKAGDDALWDVPYLLIDPHDIGREYEGIIRINSQSGKGGAAFILEQNYGLALPKEMHPVFGDIIKKAADNAQRELLPEEIYTAFENHWLKSSAPLKILDLNETHLDGNVSEVICRANVEWKGKKYSIEAEGNGPLDAFALALKQTPAPLFNITSFHEHSVGKGSDTNAMAYVKITADGGKTAWGAGKSSNVGRAGIAAVVSAINDL